MFKKKWPFRRRFSKSKAVIPVRKIPRTIARVRTDWQNVYSVTDPNVVGGNNCTYLAAPWAPLTANVNFEPTEMCFSSFAFNVMDAGQLTDLYDDDVKIVAMVGDLWMRPMWAPADACFPGTLSQLQANWDNYFIRARGALFKQRYTLGNADVGGQTPHPLYGRDWTDAGFLKTWERNWFAAPAQSTSTTYGEGQIINAIGNTHQAGYSMADGDATVPALSTDVQIVDVGNEQCFEGPSLTRYLAPGWKRVSLSSRRTIHMHEDDTLKWVIDWAQLKPPNTCGFEPDLVVPCGMHLIPSLKIKVQYG